MELMTDCLNMNMLSKGKTDYEKITCIMHLMQHYFYKWILILGMLVLIFLKLYLVIFDSSTD